MVLIQKEIIFETKFNNSHNFPCISLCTEMHIALDPEKPDSALNLKDFHSKLLLFAKIN